MLRRSILALCATTAVLVTTGCPNQKPADPSDPTVPYIEMDIAQTNTANGVPLAGAPFADPSGVIFTTNEIAPGVNTPTPLQSMGLNPITVSGMTNTAPWMNGMVVLVHVICPSGIRSLHLDATINGNPATFQPQANSSPVFTPTPQNSTWSQAAVGGTLLLPTNMAGQTISVAFTATVVDGYTGTPNGHTAKAPAITFNLPMPLLQMSLSPFTPLNGSFTISSSPQSGNFDATITAANLRNPVTLLSVPADANIVTVLNTAQNPNPLTIPASTFTSASSPQDFHVPFSVAANVSINTTITASAISGNLSTPVESVPITFQAPPPPPPPACASPVLNPPMPEQLSGQFGTFTLTGSGFNSSTEVVIADHEHSNTVPTLTVYPSAAAAAQNGSPNAPLLTSSSSTSTKLVFTLTQSSGPGWGPNWSGVIPVTDDFDIKVANPCGGTPQISNTVTLFTGI